MLKVKHFAGILPAIDIWLNSGGGSLSKKNCSRLASGVAYTIYTGWPVFDPSYFIDLSDSPSRLERRLREIDGRFSMFSVCDRGNACMIATDILGVSSVYYAVFHGKVFVASKLGLMASLLKSNLVECVPDRYGVASAALGSICLDGVTPIEGVRRLAAGEYALIYLPQSGESACRIRKSRYFNPLELLEASVGGGDWIEALQGSISGQGDVDSLMLTSGRDSFAIGALLPPGEKETLIAISYGGEHSIDRHGAAGAAGRLGLEYRSISRVIGETLGKAHEIALLTHGTCGLQTSQHYIGAQQAANYVSSAYTGFLGDILSGKPYSDTQDPQRLAMQRCLHWANTLTEPQAGWLGGEIQFCQARLRNEMAGFPGPPEKQAMMLDVLYRQAHWIGGTFELMDSVLDISTPFFSKSVLAASLSSRVSLREKRRAYEAWLTRLGHQNFSFGKGAPRGYATVDWVAETRHHAKWLATLSAAMPDRRWKGLAADAITEANRRLPITLTILPCFGLPSAPYDCVEAR